jgi:hypothetical protein
MATLPLGDITVERLNQLMRWLSTQTELVYVRQLDHEGEKQNEIPGPVAQYFAATGFRALYALPLNDDQGRVGVMTYESSDPDFHRDDQDSRGSSNGCNPQCPALSRGSAHQPD